MEYEQRLRVSKLSASGLLLSNVIVSLPGVLAEKASASHAILIFSVFILMQGLILCWHIRLFGTGRSVRMAMALMMSICITRGLIFGIDMTTIAMIIVAAATSLMSIQHGRIPAVT